MDVTQMGEMSFASADVERAKLLGTAVGGGG